MEFSIYGWFQNPSLPLYLFFAPLTAKVHFQTLSKLRLLSLLYCTYFIVIYHIYYQHHNLFLYVYYLANPQVVTYCISSVLSYGDTNTANQIQVNVSLNIY